MIVKLDPIVVVLSVMSCAPASKVSPAVSLQKEMAPSVSMVVLGQNDVIDVKFKLLPELDSQQSIRPDGKISLQMVDERKIVSAIECSPVC
jgi:hypothetical protein